MKLIKAIAMVLPLIHVPLASSAYGSQDYGLERLDTVCWKNSISRDRECVKVQFPSQDCALMLALQWRSIENFDADRDGVISVNDLGLLFSDMQRETEGLCGRRD